MIKLLLIFFLVFLFLGYPLFAYIRYLFLKKNILRSEEFSQPVSIIIACYNEADYIGEKIRSYLDKNEWIEGSEIIVVSSGCTDNSNIILDSFLVPEKLIVIKPEQRMSKIDSINMAVDFSKNDLLVFSDCRQKMKPGSIKKLIRNFNDPSIGTVVASLEDPDPERKLSFFRKLLNFINYYDGQTGSCMNVYGALYAQRKCFFKKFPDNIIFDDLFVVVSTLSQGKWLVQEKEAVIFDVPFDLYYSSERIERLARGLLLFLFRQGKLIRQLSFGDQIRFLLYKYFKLVIPFFLLLLTVYGVRFLIVSTNFKLSMILLAFVFLILSLKRTRELLMLTIRINYYFMFATLMFIFFKKRSVSWAKLKSDKVRFF